MIPESARDPLVKVLNERDAQLIRENSILRAAFTRVVEDNHRLRRFIEEARCATSS